MPNINTLQNPFYRPLAFSFFLRNALAPLHDPTVNALSKTLDTAIAEGGERSHVTPPTNLIFSHLFYCITLSSRMASSLQQAPAATIPPNADVVGNAFVHQYYLILQQSPELVHRFYQEMSKLGRPEENGVMSITTTMQAINEKILSFGCGKLSADITTVDAQDSYNGGFFVLVTGYLTGNDNSRRKFTQSFFLAPQENGYFVLNDVFRFVDDAIHQNASQSMVNDMEGTVAVEHDSPVVQENHVADPATAIPNNADGEKVYNHKIEEVSAEEEEEVPVVEVVNEIPDDSLMVAESDSKIEEVPRKSYASIVKFLKESAGPFTSPSPAPSRPAQKIQDQQQAAAPTPALPSETIPVSTNVSENENTQETEADGHSIYVKGLPLNATHSLLENEFKKFGHIKVGGIQVRSQKGFCFGFVEFETASSVQSAIEASPITINSRQVVIEEKRSTNRGYSRGRFSSARGNGYRNEGTYRNDGTRGRGNYGGGRGYGRGDYSNRGEFGNRASNRGGVPNHGGDGYHRSENGRMNRAGGGLAVSAASKNTAVRASA